MKNSSDPWQCQITLRKEEDDKGVQLTATSRCIKSESFGGIITDIQDLEDMIKRAQLALLNPSVPSNRFVNYDLNGLTTGPPLGSSRQLPFSSNIICLDISGPDLVDLSFIDLPG